MKGQRDLRISFGDRTVSGLWLEAADPIAVCLIAHGAGSDMRHPFLDGVAASMAGACVSSLRFNFPYTEAGRRGPDRPPLLTETWRAVLDRARADANGLPLVASGKSLGGRMASMVAAEDGDAFAAAALVFFGYPLHAPGRADKPRDEHLPRITVPMLFIQGTADALARFDLTEALVERLGPRARLHAVEGGDHSFRVRGAKRPDDEIGRALGAIAAAFIASGVAG
jgi:uncharacterized protein